MNLRRLARLSRPRFWLYEAGTFAVGVAAAVARGGGTLTWDALAWLLYFLVPANVLIYGVNDVFDYETDRRNPKKQGYEDVLPPSEHRAVLAASLIGTLLFARLLAFAPPRAWWAFALFVFCAVQYSAPPIRAKARPVLDSIFSAGHYVATGWFGYLLAGGAGYGIVPVVAGMSWAMAMHAYSAVPDIQADKESGIATIATFFGARATIMLCAGLYSLAAACAYGALGAAALIMLVPYLTLMASSLAVRDDHAALAARYRVFPWLNAAAGAAIWWLIVLR